MAGLAAGRRSTLVALVPKLWHGIQLCNYAAARKQSSSRNQASRTQPRIGIEPRSQSVRPNAIIARTGYVSST